MAAPPDERIGYIVSSIEDTAILCLYENYTSLKLISPNETSLKA